MASLSILQPRKFSDSQFIGDLMVLFERRRVKCGDPSSFENFAAQLASNPALRGDLFTLSTAISHMAAHDLTGEELLTLVARALAGPGVAKGASVPDIPESMRKAFLDGYEAWGKRGLPSLEEVPVRPPSTNVVGANSIPSSNEDEFEPVNPEGPADGSRTFNSALGIAMERKDNRLFLANHELNGEAASTQQNEVPAEVSPAPEPNRYRIGVGFLYSLAGVMVVASGFGGYMGYRSMNQVLPKIPVAAKSPVPALKQPPPGIAMLPAGSMPLHPAPTVSPRPAKVETGPAGGPVAASAAVPVASGAQDTSNAIIGFAPSPSNPIRANDSAAGVSGTVMLEVSISAQGKVKSVRVLSGPPELQAKALKTIQQWRFKPSVIDGVPTEQTTTLGLFLKGE